MSRICCSINFVYLVWIGRPSSVTPTPNPPNIQMAVNPRTNRNRKTLRWRILYTARFITIVRLRNDVERVEVAQAFLCVPTYFKITLYNV